MVLIIDLLNYEKCSKASGFTTTLPYNTTVPFTPKHTHYLLTVRATDKKMTVKTGRATDKEMTVKT
jgi:hypothetical protein